MHVPPRSDVGVLLAVARAAGARRRLRLFVPVGFQLQCVLSGSYIVTGSVVFLFVNAVEAGHTARSHAR
jgi:hypothetical protein